MSPQTAVRPLLLVAMLGLAPAAFAQQLPLPASLQLLPGMEIGLPPISLPQLPPLPVIPVGPPLQGQIPVMYRESGVIVFYDTRSPYPIRYTLVGIVGAP